MNRRAFLQFLGAFTAGALLPSCTGEKIARAPAWAKEVMLYRVSEPLAAGCYTFSAYAGDLGIYIGGVKALGGETLFEIPKVPHPMDNPRLCLGGIEIAAPDFKSYDFCDPETRDALIRGESVQKEV